MEKQLHMKELMQKKFKREKAQKKSEAERLEGRLWDLEKRHEQENMTKLRRQAAEDKLHKKRLQAFQLSNQKAKMAEERRKQAAEMSKSDRMF